MLHFCAGRIKLMLKQLKPEGSYEREQQESGYSHTGFEHTHHSPAGVRRKSETVGAGPNRPSFGGDADAVIGGGPVAIAESVGDAGSPGGTEPVRDAESVRSTKPVVRADVVSVDFIDAG